MLKMTYYFVVETVCKPKQWTSLFFAPFGLLNIPLKAYFYICSISAKIPPDPAGNPGAALLSVSVVQSYLCGLTEHPAL